MAETILQDIFHSFLLSRARAKLPCAVSIKRALIGNSCAPFSKSGFYEIKAGFVFGFAAAGYGHGRAEIEPYLLFPADGPEAPEQLGIAPVIGF